jgi:carbon storage regulator
MLVLTRHVDESIAIGDSIILTVLAIEGDRVKLGISAPRDILILRHEIYQAVQEQGKLEERLVEQPEPDSFQKLRELLSPTEDQDNKEEDGDKKVAP